ncbi:MAG: PDDEXK nuclease domain-containing protein [Bacteroidales bacterium]|jgi:predicted nuclease of restriction endonuclease-like (RecB) superfamily|nr:PDDEXK nuclease domain-containing protein [Bacteroidales bacterium]
MLIKDSEYKQWLCELKQRIRQSQIKAAIKVNTELLHLYWDLGHDIVIRQMDVAWGSGFFEQLSKELRAEFPEMKGFSERNLYNIKRFYLFYNQADKILQQVAAKLENENFSHVARKIQNSDNKKNKIPHQVGAELENHPIFQIPWFHHVQIFTKCKSVNEAFFYVQKTIQNGWSRAVLMNFMEADLYAAQGKAPNNFSKLLPEPQSDLANEILKDPYNFDFITLTKDTDNPTIGLLICKTKDNIEVEYSLESSSQPIGISEYQLSKVLLDNYKSALPSIEEIEAGLRNGN